ncbi:hypothetical protein [Natrarchaeobius oligotrophus]|uniref:hypothetical protein n=1 Tax=Natrarchaeobius oligotrophus TaxID=3455743 RepID=UPI000F51D432|nr:hypothetical protein [Natrarchaeobius chitinivorans]
MTGDKLLSLFFFIVGLYMFVESYTFPRDVAIFPRFVSAVIMVGSTLLLCREFLPKPLKILVEDEGQDRTSIDEKLDVVDEDLEGLESHRESADNAIERIYFRSLSVNKGLFTASICLLYVIASYLIGMHYTTPLFAMVYLYITGKPLYIVASFGIIGYIISSIFIVFLEADLMNGVLLP